MMFINKKKFTIVCTNIINGKPVYINPSTENWLICLEASSSLPILTKKPIKIDGESYLDGGFSDPLPVDKAIEDGAEKILIIRTRPENCERKGDFDKIIGSIIYRDDPIYKRITVGSSSIYKRKKQRLKQLINDGFPIDQIAPKIPLRTERTSYSKDTLNHDYRLGLECGLNYLNNILYQN